MFTPAQTKNLTEFLSNVNDQEKVITLPELHGYLFGIAITPVPKLPPEWISALFGDKLLEVEDAKNTNRQLKSLTNAYNKLVELNNERKLVYPFGKEMLKKQEDLNTVTEWTRGFFRAIRLHPDYWIFTRDILNNLQRKALGMNPSTTIQFPKSGRIFSNTKRMVPGRNWQTTILSPLT